MNDIECNEGICEMLNVKGVVLGERRCFASQYHKVVL